MEQKIRNNIAYHVKIERVKKSLNQKQLAALTKISVKHISKIESAAVTPSVFILYKLAELFDISVERLISDNRD